MSSSAGSANSARYVDFDEYVELKLQKTRSSIKTTDLLVALAGVAAMFLGYLLVFVALDQWVVPGGFGIGLRWTLLLLLLAATVAWLVWKVGRPYLRSVNGLFAAREIEKSEPGLKSNLLNLVDLRAAGREVDPTVMRALERHAAVQLQQIDVTQAIDHRPLMRTTYVLLAVLVMFCLYALFSPKKISNSIWRALLPPADVDVATRTLIVSVQPGDVTVLARQHVEITVDLAGVIPERAEVLFTTVDGKYQNERVELRALEGQARFTGSLRGENGQGLMQDLTYVVRANDAVSQTFRITVDQPPSATPEKVKFEFPAYMKLETTEQLGGQIDAWEGTKVTLSARTNLPVKSAVVEFLDNPTDLKSNGEEVPMTVASDGLHLEAKWPLVLRSDATYAKHYRIQCRTEAGVTDPQPTVYGITIRPDLPPEIALLEPVRDLEAPANTAIPLLIQARDPDFELSRINLHVEKAGQSLLNETLSDTKQSRTLLKYDLNLAPLELSAGDVIEFWIEAFDNKQPRANRKNTPRLKVTIVKPVSQKEAEQQLADDRKQRDQRLADAQQEEKNGDGTPEQQQAGGDSENQPNDPNTPEREPMPRENGETGKEETSGNDGDSGKPGQPKGKGKDQGKTGNDGDSSEPGTAAPKTGDQNNDNPQPNGPDKNGPDKNGTGPAKPKPLSSDGDDDDKALEQLIQKLGPPREDKPGKDSPSSDAPKDGSKDQPQPPGANGEKDPKQAKPNPDNTGAEPKSNGAKNDPATQDNPQPGPMPAKTDPDQTGLDKPEQAKPKDGVKPSADSKTGNDSKNDKTNKGTQPDATEKPQPNETKGPKNEKGPKGTEPLKNGASTPPENAADKGDMPKNESSSDKKQDDATKPGAGDKPAANSPKKEGPDKQPPAGKQPGEPNSDSPREPATDSPDAIKKPGMGDEKGPAKPENDPDSKAAPKKNDDSKRDSKDKTSSRTADPKNGETLSPSKNDPKAPKPPGKPSDEPKTDQQPTEPGKSPMPRNAQKQPQQGDPKTSDEPLKSDKGKDQKSDKPTGGGEPGQAKPDKTGKPGSQQPGEGDPGKEPGQEQQADSKTGKNGDSKQPGPGSKTQSKDSAKNRDSKGTDPNGDNPAGKDADAPPPGDPSAADKPNENNPGGKSPRTDQKKPGQERGKKPGDNSPPDPKSADGQEGDKPGDDKPGDGKQGQEQSPAEQSESKPPAGGKPSKKAGGGAAGKPGKQGNGASGQDSPPPDGGPNAESGDAAAVEQSEAANLEYNRQASELVLKRLQDELERGDVDPELLEQLGWTEAEMQRFAERLGKHLQEAKSAEETPESLARRQQFEEMLKSLDLKKQGVKRAGEQGATRDVNLNESRKANVPPQYRKAYEQFTKDLARQKAPAAKGPAK